jgi:hypothetical protein
VFEIFQRAANDYCSFLLKTNGGNPTVDYSFSFVENNKKTDSVLGEIYRIAKSSEFTTLEEACETFVACGRMPVWLIPIACDSFGNQICISIRDSDYNSMYFWNHEKEITDSSSEDANNISFINKSFTGFLDPLEVMDDD